MIRNVVIIGSGPAGLTAGIYTARAKLNPLIIEGELSGGQLMTTTMVENWPGSTSIPGPDLMMNMRDQAIHCGAEVISENVTSVDFSSLPYKITYGNGKTVETKAVIVATGASHKKLGCPGEKEYWGKGVTVCATCDAPFYEGKEVIIVGGGNSAMTEADYLTRFASKVTVIHILDKITANDPIKDRVLVHPKVNFIYSSTVTEIHGNGENVTGVITTHQQTGEKTRVKTDGVFIAIGLKPNSDLFKGQLDMDKYGIIQLTSHTQTSKPGIFAAGDIVDYRYKQAITSAGDGCKAALDCEIYLTGQVTGSY